MKKVLLSLMAVLMVCTMANAQARRGVQVSTKDATIQKMLLQKAQAGSTKDGSDITVFPYSLDFEDGTLGGWHSVDADNDGFSWTTNNYFGQGAFHNGSNGAATSASYDNDTYSALTPDNWLISPRIVVPAGTSLELSWYAAAMDPDYAADHYSVYVSTDSTITSFTTALYTETLSSDVYAKHSIDLTSYAGQTIYVAFRHHACTDEFMLAIDDIAIAQAGMPELAINVPSVASKDDNVSLSATLLSGDNTNLTYAWTLQGATPATATTANVTAVWAQEGTYTVTCVATNAMGSDTATAQIAVLDCGTVTTFPYTESFENGLGCWLPIDVDADGDNWETIVYDEDGSSAAVSRSYYNGVVLTPDNWLISPEFAIPQEGTFELSWFVAPSSAYYPAEHYAVYVSTTGTAVSDFTDSLFSETLDENDEFQYRNVGLSAYAGQTIHIAFRHFDCTDEYALMIDDVTVATSSAPMISIVAPAHARNTDVVTFSANVISSSEVTSYAWTFEGGQPATATTATAEVTFAEGGVHQVTLIVANQFGADTATASISILDCSGNLVAPFTEGFENGLGCWGSLDLDGDNYGWESLYEHMVALGMTEGMEDYVHGGSDAAVSWSYYLGAVTFFGVEGISLNANDVLVSPAIELAAGQEWKLSFFASSFGGADYPDDIEVRVATTNPTTAADFTTVILNKETVQQADYKQFILDLTQFAGQTIYLGFFHESSDMMGLVIDDIEVSNTVVSIDNAMASTVSLYPNPTDGALHVSAEGLLSVEVLDVNGRMVMRSEAADLNLSTLTNGIYVVRTLTTNGVAVNKIVKK